jgi:lipopolysaccharide biosynthesis glycosyltransferase
MESIKLFSAADAVYAQHLGVMLTSLLENTTSKSKIEFYIIDGGIPGRDKGFFQQLALKYGCNIRFLTIDPNRYQNLTLKSYFGYTAYFRIFISELVDSSIEKMIYLDSDMVVKGDIAKLWEVDVSRYFLAAVPDIGMNNNHYSLKRKGILGIPVKAKYFNSGVLVMNLAKWREYNISETVRDYIMNHPERLVFSDQDALNAVLFDKWLPLPFEWNQQASYYLFKHNKIMERESGGVVQKPMIIHYTLSLKPWHYMCTHPLKNQYYKYLKMTQWKGFIPADRTLKNIYVKSFVGKMIHKYLNTVKNHYSYDKAVVPEKVNRLFLFKLVYFILFPLGYTYLQIVEVSYYIELKKLAPGICNRFIGWKILYIIIFPMRFLLNQPAKFELKSQSLHQKETKACPCCGYQTLGEVPFGMYEICKICYWKDDPLQCDDPDYEGGANRASLRQARRNFAAFGASEEKFLRWVRKPKRMDKKV